MRVARAAAVVSVILQIGSLAAGETPRPPIEHATTELVLIETYVTDGRGRPVIGLSEEDFELLVDGKKRPIASFEHREVAFPGPGAAGAESRSVASDASGPGIPRRFMLFFEDGTSAPQGLTAARLAADKFLKSGLAPSDEVAIAAYDSGLRILHDFTVDRDALRRVIAQSLHESKRISDLSVERQAREERIQELLMENEQDTLMTEAKRRTTRSPGVDVQRASGGGALDAAPPSSDGTPRPESSNPPPPLTGHPRGQTLDQIKSLTVSYAAEETPRLRAVLRALGTLVDSLADWRGFKSIVFMGDGIPENAAQAYVERITEGHPDPDLAFRIQPYSLTSDLEALTRAATAAGVTIHTLQTYGLAAGTAAEMRATFRRANSLKALAINTGGLSSSSNDFRKALDQFESSSRSYYILGYSPEGPADGRFHSIHVRCRKGGLLLRSRQGFTRLPPAEARQRNIQAAHLLPELYTSLPIDLMAAAGPAVPSGRVADLVIHLPTRSLLFLPEGGRPIARLEVGLVALDEVGNEAFRIAHAVRIALPEGGGANVTGIDLYCRVLLPPKAQRVTAVVYDDDAGALGAARLSIPESAAEADEILGLSLYSLTESSLWIEIPAAGKAVAAADQPADYRIGPALKTEFAQGEPLVSGFRRIDPAGDRPAALRVVIRQGGRTVRTIGVDPADAGSGKSSKVPLPVDGLPAGDYLVTVAETIADHLVDRATVPLRLRAADQAKP